MIDQLVIGEYSELKVADAFELFREVYDTTEFMSDEFHCKFNSPEYFQDYHNRILSQSGSFIIITTCKESPVGYLILEANSAVHLQHTSTLNMGILKSFRGKGVGKFLLKHALARAKAEQITEIIYLMVRAENTPAIRLYKKFGFAELVRLEKDTKIGFKYFDGILMRRFV